MSYPNAYLRDFVPVLGQILKEKQIAPEKLHLEIIDEESEEKSIFEPVGVDEVLDQLADQLNHLTVYTDRPAHFQAFAEQIYEENAHFHEKTVEKPFVFRCAGRGGQSRHAARGWRYTRFGFRVGGTVLFQPSGSGKELHSNPQETLENSGKS